MKELIILHVAIYTPVYRLFDYLPPDEITPVNLKPGLRLWVPFRNQRKVGILMSVSHTSDCPTLKLRRIFSFIDEEPIIPPVLMQLKTWVSHYYHYPVGEVMLGTLPKILRDGKNLSLPHEVVWKITEKGKEAVVAGLMRSKKQKTLLSLLAQYPSGLTAKNQLLENYTSSFFKNLETKGFIEPTLQEEEISIYKTEHPKHPLNIEQQYAVSTVTSKLGHFNTFLLQGITGSGKTEVYLHCIHAVLKNNQQALVLVPEIGLTPQTVLRFQNHFSIPIAVLHSGCSDKDRYHAWQRAKSGKIKIIIGTRSAIFTPFQSLGIIIIDEAHDLSFKQQDSLRYSARDLSIMRAHIEKIPVILGSATPSFESILHAKNGRSTLLHLTKRTGNAILPKYTVLDIRNQPLREGFSVSLIESIKTHLDANNQVLLFLNRRGFAPTLLCHLCGWIARCKHCDARLTLHHQPERLHCHHCDTVTTVISSCQQCQSTQLIPIGQGTERIEKVVEKLFPHYPSIRIDRDSTRKKGALAAILKQISEGKSQILIGTQMLAKGHHFPNVTLVVILDADSGFFSADFRAEERMAQLILQVGGRAGRENKAGEVIIQTHQPNHPALITLLRNGYESFVETALKERKEANLPPYSHMALVKADCIFQPYPMEFLHKVKSTIQYHPKNDMKILGPIPSPMEKRAGRYRAQLLLQCSSRSQLHALLSVLTEKIHLIKTKKKVRWSLDVDPVEMF